MINQGKCPKCDSSVNAVNVEDITLDVFMAGPKWKGFSYSCQRCHAVLGVELNPLAVREEIVAEVARMLRE